MDPEIIFIALVLGGLYLAMGSGGGGGAVTIADVVNAIIIAEGGNIPGTRPYNDNNPGDLESGDDYFGTSTGMDGPLLVFDSYADGEAALTQKVANIFNGTSDVYSTGMSIDQLAETYTGGDNAADWAASVAQTLGVPSATTLADLNVTG